MLLVFKWSFSMFNKVIISLCLIVFLPVIAMGQQPSEKGKEKATVSVAAAAQAVPTPAATTSSSGNSLQANLAQMLFQGIATAINTAAVPPQRVATTPVANRSGDGDEQFYDAASDEENFLDDELDARLKPLDVETEYRSSAQDLEIYFRSAPADVAELLRYLRNPAMFAQLQKNILLLVGPYGTGKSTLACALAYKAGWRCEFLTAADFKGNGARNVTGDKLHDKIEEIAQLNEKTVIVLDEMNTLVEYFESENHDSGYTALTLWQLLDKYRKSPNLFFIFTANRDHKNPPQLKKSCAVSN